MVHALAHGSPARTGSLKARQIMLRYRVWIDQEFYLVEIDGDQIQVNGEDVVPSALTALNDQGLFRFQQNGHQQEIHIQRESLQQFHVTIGGHHITVEVERERGNGHSGKTRPLEQQAGEVRAPMHAAVIAVLVSPGDQVEEGQPLLVLEAMKMQMKIHSPCAAAVEQLVCEPGSRVEKGEVLVRLRPL
jgi:biotin carboxyl carrier protein